MKPLEVTLKKIIYSFAFFASLSATLSFAATNRMQGNIGTGFLDTITPDRVSHFSIFSGPAIDGDNNPRSFDGTLETSGISSWHQVSFGWDIAENTRFVINPRFVLEESSASEGQAVARLDNPVLGITKLWYKNGNFTFSGGLNTIFATVTDSSREAGLEWNPGGFQAANYEVNNRIDVGTWLWGRYRYFRKDAEKSRAPIFVSPYITYENNDYLKTQIFYQVNGRVENDTIDTFVWDPDEHLNFSIIYQLSERFSVQPIITVFRETDFSLSKGNINMWISGRFF